MIQAPGERECQKIYFLPLIAISDHCECIFESHCTKECLIIIFKLYIFKSLLINKLKNPQFSLHSESSSDWTQTLNLKTMGRAFCHCATNTNLPSNLQCFTFICKYLGINIIGLFSFFVTDTMD